MTSGIATHLKLQRLRKPLYISAVSISRWAVPICYRRCVTGSGLLGHHSCLPSAALGSSSSTVISLLDFCGAESPQLNSNGGRWMIGTAVVVVTFVMVLCLYILLLWLSRLSSTYLHSSSVGGIQHHRSPVVAEKDTSGYATPIADRHRPPRD